MRKTAIVTSKGQVTIPKEIREILGSDVIEFAVENESILLRPVKRVDGKLRSYANPSRNEQEPSA